MFLEKANSERWHNGVNGHREVTTIGQHTYDTISSNQLYFWSLHSEEKKVHFLKSGLKLLSTTGDVKAEVRTTGWQTLVFFCNKELWMYPLIWPLFMNVTLKGKLWVNSLLVWVMIICPHFKCHYQSIVKINRKPDHDYHNKLMLLPSKVIPWTCFFFSLFFRWSNSLGGWGKNY